MRMEPENNICSIQIFFDGIGEVKRIYIMQKKEIIK